MIFEFVTSNRIVYSDCALVNLRDIVPEIGQTVIVVCGSGSVPIDGLHSVLVEKKIKYEVFRVEREPFVQDIQIGL